MEKLIKFSNVVFKFQSKDEDKYKNITYHFKICDKATKTKVIELQDKVSKYYNEELFKDEEYDFNECTYGGKIVKHYSFKVKDKWLAKTEFVKDVYYQGDLELNFYSMERVCHKKRLFQLMPIYHKKEGYYAKLTNAKQVEIEK